MITTGYGRSVIFNHYGKVVGFCLGHDFCAEHEYGIPSLRKKFGMAKLPITGKRIGIEARTSTIFPEKDVLFIEKDNKAMLLIKELYSSDRKVLWDKFAVEDSEFVKTGIYTAWDNDGILIFVNSEHVSVLRELYITITKKDFALLWLRSFREYEKCIGLCAVIPSNLPGGINKKLEEEDLAKIKKD